MKQFWNEEVLSFCKRGNVRNMGKIATWINVCLFPLRDSGEMSEMSENRHSGKSRAHTLDHFCVCQKELIDALLCSTLTCCFLLEGWAAWECWNKKLMFIAVYIAANWCMCLGGFGFGLRFFKILLYFGMHLVNFPLSFDEAWGKKSKNGWKDPFSSSWVLQQLSVTFHFLHSLAINTLLNIRLNNKEDILAHSKYRQFAK